MKNKYGLFWREKKNDGKELTKTKYKSHCFLAQLNEIKWYFLNDIWCDVCYANVHTN